MRVPWKQGSAIAAILALVACVEPIREHESTVGEVVRDCIVPPPPGVTALDAPASIEFPDASVWFWATLERAGATPLAGAAARVTRADDVCARGPALITDDRGSPVSVLALTASEEADNAARGDGKRLALEPQSGLVADGTGYLFYDHVVRGPGVFDAEAVGTGLCTIDPGGTRCERITDAQGSTVLWRPGERVLNRGGVVVPDAGGARALVFGCRQVAAFEHPCTVAGVPIASLRNPEAYEVWNAFKGWVPSPIDATTVSDEAGAFTLAPYGAGYVATSLDLFSSRVFVRRATSPIGPYGTRVSVFDAVPSASFFVSGGREHAALRPEPRSIAVTYRTDGVAAPGLHLVTFRFWGELR